MRQKQLDVVKAKVERATIKAKVKLAKIELQKEKLAADRERWCERVEAKAMKMQFMGGSSHLHSTHTNTHLSSHQS